MTLTRKFKFEKSVERLEDRIVLDGTGLPVFESDAGLYQIYSNYGRTGQVDFATKSFSVAEHNAGEKVNAVGFRSADNYAYGIMTKSHELGRIGSNGQVQNLGAIEGLPTKEGTYFVGDFGGDGLLYVRSGNNRGVLYGIDIDSQSVANTIRTSVDLYNIYDIAYNTVYDTFYASQRGAENKLISIGMDGKVSTIGENGLQKLTFGAMYADADGNVFGGANQTGGVYSFDIVTGKATKVAQGPISGTNDGFSNASEVLELPPLAVDDVFSTPAIAPVSGSVFADTGAGSDIDGNNDLLSIVAVNGDETAVGRAIELESGAFVQLNSDGSYSYDPGTALEDLPHGEKAVDVFEYTVGDGNGGTDDATVTMNVSGVMHSDTYSGVVLHGLGLGAAKTKVVNVGDVNGDGFDDGMVGVPEYRGAAGVSLLVYGSKNGIRNKFNVKKLFSSNGGNGKLGTVFEGAVANDLSGKKVTGLGDINGDGIDDFAVGAPDADAYDFRNSGETYVVFGKEDGFGAEFKLSSLKPEHGGDGSDGFVANGTFAHDRSGANVTSVGDLNADGIDDFAIVAQHADTYGMKNVGMTYVIFGNENFGPEMELFKLNPAAGGDGSKGFIVQGNNAHDLLGDAVQGGQDVNGDGIDDLLITSNRAEANGLVDAGQSYLIFGSREFAGEFKTSELAEENGGDGTSGMIFNGSSRKTMAGGSVRFAGDMNGDGVDDLVIGIGNDKAEANGIVFGSTERCDAEVEMIAFKRTNVYLDNFDASNEHDAREWDQYAYSATLHSSEGTQVTIWGDPHVVITLDGKTEKFDIGYGDGQVRVDRHLTIKWTTFEKSADVFNGQPPLKTFAVILDGKEVMKIDTTDGINRIDDLTGITDAQLRKFARKLRWYAGDANAPLRGTT